MRKFSAFGSSVAKVLYPILTFAASAVNAQTTSEELRACIAAGVPLYQVSSSQYTESEVRSAFYSKFCAIERDFNKLDKDSQEGVRASWLGPYGDMAGNWQKDGSTNTEEEHYKASCKTLDKEFDGRTIAYGKVNEIRGNVDQLISACVAANRDGVKMTPQIPNAPSGQLTLNFSTDIAGKSITGVEAVNMECKLDGNVIVGFLPNPRLITGTAAQVICIRAHRPISVSGVIGDYYPDASVTVTTNYANPSPNIALPEEVSGILSARLQAIEDRMIPVGTIIDLEPGKTCPPNWQPFEAGSGRFLIGATDQDIEEGDASDFSAGITGGAPTHTLTTDELPNLKSSEKFMSIGKSGAVDTNGVTSYKAKEVNIATGGEAHSIMPPYLAVVRCVKE